MRVIAVCLLFAVGTAGAVELIAPGDAWKFHRGVTEPSDPADAWRQLGFDDSGWESGPSGFGYGDDDDATVLDDMEDSYQTVYIRKQFDATGFDPDETLELAVDFDDGFIAYLNGQFLQSDHMSNGNATSHEAGSPEVYELGRAADVLNDGLNILAIEGHNVSLGSSDFSLEPALRTVRAQKTVVLSEDTTFSGLVEMQDKLTVPAGITLTIEAGTTLSMAAGVEILVQGRLVAGGTESEPITFTRRDFSAWERIMFVNAEDSVLAHCTIEYADSEGDHKDYYNNSNCDPNAVLPSREYNEAVVVIASHVDIESCTFRNLPDDSSSPEGDAIAVISDDPDNPGPATANIRNCRFISIGQGVHTRFSFVLVENCYFTGHNGDNDDIDLYGESTPPPLILNNLMLNPSHDDMINPTRCSAVLIGNVIGGCDDHGIVLRDKCRPILLNNVIFDCSSAGIAVQNQCDALLINNTIYNCGRGVRFFDHTGRWGPPYCLYPGSGKATLINTIIWDCSPPLHLTNSPYDQDGGSHATVSYCDIEGGQSAASVSSNSTLTWLQGNIDADPRFFDPGNGDFHLASEAGRWDPAVEQWVRDDFTSPCIDAGTAGQADNPYLAGFIDFDWRGELWPHGKAVNMGAYGGTVEASMSNNTDAGSAADIDRDGIVALLDFAAIARQWAQKKALAPEDTDHSGTVDFADMMLMAENWLWMETQSQ